MKAVKILAAVAGLGLTVVPSFLLLSGSIESDLMSQLMIAGFVAWIVACAIPCKCNAE